MYGFTFVKERVYKLNDIGMVHGLQKKHFIQCSLSLLGAHFSEVDLLENTYFASLSADNLGNCSEGNIFHNV